MGQFYKILLCYGAGQAECWFCQVIRSDGYLYFQGSAETKEAAALLACERAAELHGAEVERGE